MLVEEHTFGGGAGGGKLVLNLPGVIVSSDAPILSLLFCPGHQAPGHCDMLV